MPGASPGVPSSVRLSGAATGLLLARLLLRGCWLCRPLAVRGHTRLLRKGEAEASARRAGSAACWCTQGLLRGCESFGASISICYYCWCWWCWRLLLPAAGASGAWCWCCCCWCFCRCCFCLLATGGGASFRERPILLKGEAGRRGRTRRRSLRCTRGSLRSSQGPLQLQAVLSSGTSTLCCDSPVPPTVALEGRRRPRLLPGLEGAPWPWPGPRYTQGFPGGRARRVLVSLGQGLQGQSRLLPCPSCPWASPGQTKRVAA